MGKRTKRAGWLLLGIILLSLLLIAYLLLKFLFGSDIFTDIVSLFIERIIILSGVFIIVFFLVSIIISIKKKDTTSLKIATPLILVFLIALHFLGPNIKGQRDGSPYWSSSCSCTEMNGVTYFRVRKVFNGLVTDKNPDTRILENILTEHDYVNPECNTP